LTITAARRSVGVGVDTTSSATCRPLGIDVEQASSAKTASIIPAQRAFGFAVANITQGYHHETGYVLPAEPI